MGKIIAVANQKGGVGKTTTAVNLTCALHREGKRTLLVDLDPQGNATSAMGVDKNRVKSGTYDVLIGESPSGATLTTKYGYLLIRHINFSFLSVTLNWRPVSQAVAGSMPWRSRAAAFPTSRRTISSAARPRGVCFIWSRSWHSRQISSPYVSAIRDHHEITIMHRRKHVTKYDPDKHRLFSGYISAVTARGFSSPKVNAASVLVFRHDIYAQRPADRQFRLRQLARHGYVPE